MPCVRSLVHGVCYIDLLHTSFSAHLTSESAVVAADAVKQLGSHNTVSMTVVAVRSCCSPDAALYTTGSERVITIIRC
jgi:hypothetical protein